MNAQDPKRFKHTTLDAYPDEVVGITLLDEKPGFTGIYLRSPDGGLWPARTVSRRPAKHHRSVIDAWLKRDGEHIDLRRHRERLVYYFCDICEQKFKTLGAFKSHRRHKHRSPRPLTLAERLP